MLDKKQTQEIRKLIKDGYNIELISFELGIPLNEIKQLAGQNLTDSRPVI